MLARPDRAFLGLLACLCLPAAGVDAQGVAMDEDAGLSGPVDAGTDAGTDAGDPPSGPEVACRCNTLDFRNRQEIHVCTGSFDADVCEAFGCVTGDVRDAPCPTFGIELCCRMDELGLYTNLYDDCEHDNCEAGFRAQCREFGGIVVSGLCGGQTPLDDPPPLGEDDAPGLCSMTDVAGHRRPSPAGLLLAAAFLLTLRRRRS